MCKNSCGHTKTIPTSKNISQMVNLLASVLYHSRPWHQREQNAYPMHPAVVAALEKGYVPQDYHLLTLEWPHVSTKDRTMLSYTVNEEKALRDLQAPAMKPGRYLRRHFPKLSDDTIRDLVANTGCYIRIIRDNDDMVSWIQGGPYSCMRWEGRSPEYHPYRVYDPELGWALAVLFDEGEYSGRALVYEKGRHKCFVRAYGFSRGSTTKTNDGMQAMLEEMGYSHERGWPEGAQLLRVSDRYGDDIFPYLDGANNWVTINDRYLDILPEYEGDYLCDNTDGTATDRSTRCDKCGSRVDEDELTWVEHEDRPLCERCLNANYTYVDGEGYIPDDDVVWVSHCAYNLNNLPDYIVRTVDDDYIHEDDAVNVDGDYYSSGDSRVVEDVFGNYQLRDNCVKLGEHSRHWGDWVHEDDAVETPFGRVLDDETVTLDWSVDGHSVVPAEITTKVLINDRVFTVLDDDEEAAIEALSVDTKTVPLWDGVQPIPQALAQIAPQLVQEILQAAQGLSVTKPEQSEALVLEVNTGA